MKKLIKTLGIIFAVVASLNMSSAVAYGGDKAKADKKAEVKADAKAEKADKAKKAKKKDETKKDDE